MAISQPRVRKAPSEWDCTVAELEAWGHGEARNAVGRCDMAGMNPYIKEPTWVNTYLNPAEKSCKFCRAKATCPALRDELTKTTAQVTVATADEFADLTVPAVSETTEQQWLEALVEKADMFEDLLKSARAEIERRLLAGVPSEKFKLVAGKRGARQWEDAKAAESELKSMRVKVDDMYDRKLISPTSAEKLFKNGTLGDRQWQKLQQCIVQKDGGPSVQPVSDPRPALDIRPVVEDFQDVSLA